MNRLNWLFSLYSLLAVIIIIERLLPSPLLQPFNFIRLHELNQTVVFIGATVVLSFFYLKIFTQDFKTLNKKSDSLLVVCFMVGTYLYGAGEGWHEVASFTLNNYCDLKNLMGNLCNGLFINDYYAGNIIFFIGGLLMSVPLLELATNFKMKAFNNEELGIMFANAVVFAFTWFAYSAFDKVLVGLFFSTVLMIISLYYFLKIRKKFREYPFIVYSFTAYTLATIGAALVRFY